ncbi:Probable conserved lipoprotein LppL [Mycobacteroides abscessus subsp. abscessus]|uniref:hypothetical protein n=1 Tax=Mycobacteroides abscessus TaxID=36809 RepID=UPI00092B2E36|nr:hypothetical protein [Mycobacteroides abscessus]SHX48956.1 Probable conserved lipoprotein LppL [Mycobacteroides abscessus subsp. abscessus]
MMDAMNRLPRRGMRGIRGTVAALAVVITAAAAASSGCSSGGDSENSADPRVITPASAAQSPPLTTAPAGTVHRIAGQASAVLFDTSTKTVSILADEGRIVTTITRDALDTVRRVTRLPSPATAAVGDDRGTVYLSTAGGYFALDIASGRADKINIPGHENTEFSAITRRPDGRIVLGSADGTVFTLDLQNQVIAHAAGFAHIDSLAYQGNTVAVLDRAQSSVTTLTAAGDGTAHALRAGEGATTMLADDKGRLLVADTRGGALLKAKLRPSPTSPNPFACTPVTRTSTVKTGLSASVMVLTIALSYRLLAPNAPRKSSPGGQSQLDCDDGRDESFTSPRDARYKGHRRRASSRHHGGRSRLLGLLIRRR